MLDTSGIRHDSRTGRLVWESGLRGRTLVPKETGAALRKIAVEGRWNGASVTAVAVEFGDREAAEYNAAALEFLGLSALLGGEVVASGQKFVPRSDFGIPEGKGS